MCQNVFCTIDHRSTREKVYTCARSFLFLAPAATQWYLEHRLDEQLLAQRLEAARRVHRVPLLADEVEARLLELGRAVQVRALQHARRVLRVHALRELRLALGLPALPSTRARSQLADAASAPPWSPTEELAAVARQRDALERKLEVSRCSARPMASIS